MSWLASAVLAILHALYRLILVIKSLSSRFRSDPLPLAAERPKLPRHLALSLAPNSLADEEASEKYMLDSVEKVADWCQVVGIRRLTVYDRQGVLANCSMDIRERVLPALQGKEDDESGGECDIRYPLTPPPSDDADSRPLSPHSSTPVPKLSVTTIRYPSDSPSSKRRPSVSRTAVKRRRVTRHEDKEESPLTLHVISYKSGKPAIAAAATTILDDFKNRPPGASNNGFTGPSIQDLNTILEGEYGFPSPDLMIVHRQPPAGQLRSPVVLGGFPPWQMRLTEIYYDPYRGGMSRWKQSSHQVLPTSIEEVEFRRALDEFAAAEMRLGK